jgi:hypothetical protein
MMVLHIITIVWFVYFNIFIFIVAQRKCSKESQITNSMLMNAKHQRKMMQVPGATVTVSKCELVYFST